MGCITPSVRIESANSSSACSLKRVRGCFGFGTIRPISISSNAVPFVFSGSA